MEGLEHAEEASFSQDDVSALIKEVRRHRSNSRCRPSLTQGTARSDLQP